MKDEIVTVDPSVTVQWGDWCHLPATGDGFPESFVCLSPGATIRAVKYWPIDERGPAVARVYRSERAILATYIGAQADALRAQLLRRLPLIHDDGESEVAE